MTRFQCQTLNLKNDSVLHTTAIQIEYCTLLCFNGSVNGSVYQEKVLKKVILDDVLQRKKTKGLPIHKRKMFTKNSDMIFEQDFAQPHSTNANQQFMEEHFPAHIPTLWRYEDTDPLFFGPNWDDFWSIE